MTRAFASLTPQEALHVAIFIEERNAGIYHRFAEMFTEFRDAESLEIASVFWDMAVEEKRHSALLQRRYQERFGNARCSLTEEDLQEMIEVPKLEDGDVFAKAGTTQSERARTCLASRAGGGEERSGFLRRAGGTDRRRCTTPPLYRALCDGRRTRGIPAEDIGGVRCEWGEASSGRATLAISN